MTREPPPLLVHNLLNDFAGLAPLLLNELSQGASLNAYLLAAGMNQIVEDYLHPDPYSLHKVAKYLARLRVPVGPFAASAARAIAVPIARIHTSQARTRCVLHWQADFAAFVQRLADLAVQPAGCTPMVDAELLASSKALLAQMGQFPPRLLREVVRLPSCFRSFDQQLADVECIVQRFVARWPDRSRALVAIGLRTSGSYLAPLYAAMLKMHGYRHVRSLTLRPGRTWLRAERAMLQVMVRERGLALLTDDPPASGDSLAEAATELQRAGTPRHALVLLLQLFGSPDTLPLALRTYASVLLPWEEWAIHARLAPSAVQLALADFLAPAIAVRAIERLPSPNHARARSHVHARYRVQLVDRDSARQWEQHVSVKGVGLGYFGEHSLALARALRDFIPEVYGFRDGLLYRAWLPEEQRLTAIPSGQVQSLATAMATYVVARNHALAVRDDVSLRLFGRDPVWEVAGRLLSPAFGRGWLPASVAVVLPLTRRLLRVRHPSVIDGSMTLSRWYADSAERGRLRKIDFDEGAFSNVDLACYDPVFDLASLAADSDVTNLNAGGHGDELGEHLRHAYEGLSVQEVDAERWLLYQIIHLWYLQTQDTGDRPDIDRAFPRALQRYFAEIFFNDVATPVTGTLCAIDIDGVLETGALGFPGLTSRGAMALRALALHGYRPVLATGRSLGEVRERCRAYRLAGGVAEYGAVVYTHDGEQVRGLVSETERADLERLRLVLGRIEGVHLDPSYHHAVRAYRLSGAGQRRGLSHETVATAFAVAAVQGRVRPIFGDAQTDFMVVGVDKGTGLRALASLVSADVQALGEQPLILAVGDSVSDLPMFDLAKTALAPANADAAVRGAGVRVLRQSYQAGLGQAVSHLLGHLPGGCPVCRPPRLSCERRMLLTLLAAQETGTRGILRTALLLGTRVWLTAIIPNRGRGAPAPDADELKEPQGA